MHLLTSDDSLAESYRAPDGRSSETLATSAFHPMVMDGSASER
jgi:hypothetical protein